MLVSPDNMTASAPSMTALATSNTSARVGIMLLIMDCIIWVAVMAIRSMLLAILIRLFWTRRQRGIADFNAQIARGRS